MSAGIKTWTRRAFLNQVGQAGGAAAVYRAMAALGLMPEPEPWTGPVELPAGSGHDKTVLILGAGIAGLAAAYELTRAGFKCSVLEAQPHAGGRNFTVRRGTVITEESAEHGTTGQKCDFDEGLYVNLGPGRIPYHHRRMLHYCSELGRLRQRSCVQWIGGRCNVRPSRPVRRGLPLNNRTRLSGQVDRG